MPASQDVLFYVLASKDKESINKFITKLVNKINTEQRQADIRLETQADCLNLEQAIWQYKPQSFIANSIAKQLPANIQLWEDEIIEPCNDVLLNLHSIFPENFAQYNRVIEVLDSSDKLIVKGRQRWKQYQQQGLKPVVHKIG